VKHLIVFCCLLVFFSVSTLFAQTDSPLILRKVSVEFDKETLPDALLTLSTLADFNLSFNANILVGKEVVAGVFENEDVLNVLHYILPKDIQVKHSGNNVILLPKKAAPKKALLPTFRIKGRILDELSGNPIPEVTVLDLQKGKSVLSNADGYFTLSVTPRDEQIDLSLSRHSFQDTLILLKASNHTLELSLIRAIGKTSQPVSPLTTSAPEPVEKFGVSQLLLPRKMVVHANNIRGYSLRNWQFSFSPGLSSNYKLAGSVKNKISLSLLGAYSYGLSGFEVSALFNVNRHNVSGFQFAGTINLSGGDVRGFQFAGISNALKGSMKGWQLAGVFNAVNTDASGVQMAGVSNFVKGSFTGVQIAGVLNYASGGQGSLQLAGVANISRKNLDCFQVAPLYNQSKTVDRLQFSSGLNLTDTLKGVQIGLINGSTIQRGLQVGLINLSDTIVGKSIGLFTFSRRGGYYAMEVSSSAFLPANLHLHSGGHSFYNTYSVGYSDQDGVEVWGLGLGFGAASGNRHKWQLRRELGFNWVRANHEFKNWDLSLLRLDLLLQRSVSPRLKVFLGPSANFLVYWPDQAGETVKSISPYPFAKGKLGNNPWEAWPGLQLGAQVKFGKGGVL
jgi:hypothetical protein